MQCSRTGGTRGIKGMRKKMISKILGRGSVLVLLLMIVKALLVCAEGGRELTNEKASKEHPATASEKGEVASGDMLTTNDYGRYDPTPAFSKPRFKLIPN